MLTKTKFLVGNILQKWAQSFSVQDFPCAKVATANVV